MGQALIDPSHTFVSDAKAFQGEGKGAFHLRPGNPKRTFMVYNLRNKERLTAAQKRVVYNFGKPILHLTSKPDPQDFNRTESPI